MALAELLVPIAPGELIDKITILEIKSDRIEDVDKLANVRTELAFLSAVSEKKVPKSEELDRFSRDLKAVNTRIWDLEDEIRDFERNKEFGAGFEKSAPEHLQDRRRAGCLEEDQPLSRVRYCRGEELRGLCLVRRVPVWTTRLRAQPSRVAGHLVRVISPAVFLTISP